MLCSCGRPLYRCRTISPVAYVRRLPSARPSTRVILVSPTFRCLGVVSVAAALLQQRAEPYCRVLAVAAVIDPRVPPLVCCKSMPTSIMTVVLLFHYVHESASQRKNSTTSVMLIRKTLRTRQIPHNKCGDVRLNRVRLYLPSSEHSLGCSCAVYAILKVHQRRYNDC